MSDPVAEVDEEFKAHLREFMRDNSEAMRRLSRHDGGHGLHDARRLHLILLRDTQMTRHDGA